MIKLQVIGHLGKDATTNNVNGKSVINFTVAHSEKYKDAHGNQVDKTTWVECSYWTERTGLAPYLKKGGQIYAEGSPEVRTYAKNDGTTGVSLTLRVVNVQLLGSANGSQNQPATHNAQPAATTGATNKKQNPAQDITEPIDDLPF